MVRLFFKDSTVNYVEIFCFHNLPKIVIGEAGFEPASTRFQNAGSAVKLLSVSFDIPKNETHKTDVFFSEKNVSQCSHIYGLHIHLET